MGNIIIFDPNVVILEPSKNPYANQPFYKPVAPIQKLTLNGKKVQKITYRDTHRLMWKIGQVAIAIMKTLASLGLILIFPAGKKMWRDAINRFKRHQVHINTPPIKIVHKDTTKSTDIPTIKLKSKNLRENIGANIFKFLNNNDLSKASQVSTAFYEMRVLELKKRKSSAEAWDTAFVITQNEFNMSQLEFDFLMANIDNISKEDINTRTRSFRYRCEGGNFTSSEDNTYKISGHMKCTLLLSSIWRLTGKYRFEVVKKILSKGALTKGNTGAMQFFDKKSNTRKDILAYARYEKIGLIEETDYFYSPYCIPLQITNGDSDLMTLIDDNPI